MKKRETPQNCKSPMQRQRFITTLKSVTEYTHIHTHPQAKSKKSNKNKVQQIDPVNKRNPKLYLPEQNQPKHKLEKTLMLGKTEGKRRGWQKMRWLDSIIDSVDMNLSKFPELALHSSTLAWKIPWAEEPGGLLSMGSHRVGHD